MTTTTAEVQTTVPVKHHSWRNTGWAVLVVFLVLMAAAGIRWVWVTQDSGTQIREKMATELSVAQKRIAELSNQLTKRNEGKELVTRTLTPATEAPAPQVAPAQSTKTTAAEIAQFNATMKKRALELLPTPAGGTFGTMTETKKVGTAPSGDGLCRDLEGTKHDRKTKGTYQIWQRVSC